MTSELVILLVAISCGVGVVLGYAFGSNRYVRYRNAIRSIIRYYHHNTANPDTLTMVLRIYDISIEAEFPGYGLPREQADDR